MPNGNNRISEKRSDLDLSEHVLFYFGALSIIEKMSAEKRSDLCAKPSRFTVYVEHAGRQ